MLATVPSRCRSALDNEFRTGEMLSVDRHHHAGPALIHLMKTEEPIGVIAGLKPATGSAWIPHRRLQTDSVGLQKAVAATLLR